jgi:tripartite-type tricarboxylate transporter receptor subunit TctC
MSVVGRHLLIAATATVLAAVSTPLLAESNWPERPIEIVVPWSAGGGTDVIVRQIAAILEEDLGQPVNVVNRTGGAGIIGHTALAEADPDGYTFGTVNVDLSQTLCLGQTNLTYENYEHIALFSADPSALLVQAQSPWHSVDELLAAIEEEPAGTYFASGTVRGGIHHLSFVGWLQREGLEPGKVTWIPADGEAPAIRDLAAGSVHIASPPLSSARAMIEDDQVRPLATMGAERNPLFPDVPTIAEARIIDWNMGTWRMLAGPAGLPEGIRDAMEDALHQAAHSERFIEFMEANGFQRAWMSGDEAREYHRRQDTEICEVMEAAGMLEN